MFFNILLLQRMNKKQAPSDKKVIKKGAGSPKEGMKKQKSLKKSKTTTDINK